MMTGTVYADPLDEVDKKTIEAQAKLNTLVAARASEALQPIFEAVHQAPNTKMCAALSTVLLKHGLDLWSAFIEELEAQKPKEGAIPADRLKVATGFAAQYGSPIVGGLTHALDLRPPMSGPGGRPPMAGFCQELGPDGRPITPPMPTWREDALKALPTIAEELQRRGFRLATPAGDPTHGVILDTVLEADSAIIVRVWTSPYEAEPFILELVRTPKAQSRLTFEPAPAQATLIRGHSTTQDHLLRTVDAFLAGLWQHRPGDPPLKDKLAVDVLKELFQHLSYPALNLDVAYVDQARPESGFTATTQGPVRQLGSDAPYDDGRRYRIRVELGQRSPLLVDIMEAMPQGGVILVPAKECAIESAKAMIDAFLAGFWTARRG